MCVFQIFLSTNKNIFIFIFLIFLTILLGIIILNIEFIFLVYLMVYLGATSILFLFALVVVDPREENDFTVDRYILCMSTVVVDLSFTLLLLLAKPSSLLAGLCGAEEEPLSTLLPLNPAISTSGAVSYSEQPEFGVLGPYFFNNCSELVVMGGFFLTLTVIAVALFNKKL